MGKSTLKKWQVAFVPWWYRVSPSFRVVSSDYGTPGISTDIFIMDLRDICWNPIIKLTIIQKIRRISWRFPYHHTGVTQNLNLQPCQNLRIMAAFFFKLNVWFCCEWWTVTFKWSRYQQRWRTWLGPPHKWITTWQVRRPMGWSPLGLVLCRVFWGPQKIEDIKRFREVRKGFLTLITTKDERVWCFYLMNCIFQTYAAIFLKLQWPVGDEGGVSHREPWMELSSVDASRPSQDQVAYTDSIWYCFWASQSFYPFKTVKKNTGNKWSSFAIYWNLGFFFVFHRL